MTTSLYHGTVILAAGGLATKIISFVFNVYLVRLVGPEPIGIYKMVFPVYFTLLILACAGVPYAVSKLVAEYKARREYFAILRLVYLALALLLGPGILASLGLLAAGGMMAGRVFSDPRVYLAVIASAPGLLVVTVASVLRGYFQGLQEMAAIALSQVVEQLVHSGLSLAFAWWLLPLGVAHVAAGLTAAMVLGEVTGLLVLALLFRASRRRLVSAIGRYQIPRGGLPGMLREMFPLAAPITVGELAASLSTSLNVIIVPARLQAGGLTVEQATNQFGQLNGIVFPLVFLPAILTVALAVNLVPSISGALASRNRRLVRVQTEKSLELTCFLGLPVSAALAVLARPLCGVIFGFPEAGPILSIIAPGALFAYLRQTTAGILQGMGKPTISVMNYIIATSLENLAVWFLAADPRLGLKGAAIAAVTNFFIGGMLNLYWVWRLVRYTLDLPFLLHSTLATVAMAWLMNRSYTIVASAGAAAWQATLYALALGGALYLLAMMLTGTPRRLGIRWPWQQ